MSRLYILLTLLYLLACSTACLAQTNCKTQTDVWLMGYKGQVKRIVKTRYEADTRNGRCIKATPDKPYDITTLVFDKKGKDISETVVNIYNKTTARTTFQTPAPDSVIEDIIITAPKSSPDDTSYKQRTRQWLSSTSYRDISWVSEKRNGSYEYIKTLKTVETTSLDKQCREQHTDLYSYGGRLPIYVSVNKTYNGNTTLTENKYPEYNNSNKGTRTILAKDKHGNPTLMLNQDFNGEKLLELSYEYY